MIRSFVEAGHQVICAAGGDDSETRAKLKAMDVEYVSLPLNSQGTNFGADQIFIRSIRSELERNGADTLICYTVKPVVYGAAAVKRKPDVRFFPMITGLGYAFQPGGAKQKLLRAAAQLLYRNAMTRATKAIFQNPVDVQDFLRMRILKDNSKVVMIDGSGIDLQRFEAKPLPKGPITFLLVTRLIREKGVMDYIQAAQILKNHGFQAKFLLVGGADKNPHAIDPSEFSIEIAEGVIEYLGELGDVRPAFEKCHVFVLPSYYREGLPRTILEALATGRTVITCDSDGCRHAIDTSKFGKLIPPMRPDLLAKAMEEYVTRPERAVTEGARARKYAEERFDVCKINRQILEAIG